MCSARLLEPDPIERCGGRPAALARGRAGVEQAVRDVLERAVRLEQVKLLEDEPDPPCAQRGESAVGGLGDVAAGDPHNPAAWRRSSVPMMCSSVDLPDPEGPTIAHSSPSQTVRFTPRSACTPPG